MDTEKTGVVLVLLTLFVEATLPILSKYLVGFVNPLFLGAIICFVAFVPIGLFLSWTGKLKVLFQRDMLFNFAIIAFFGSFIYTALMLSGARLTSGINTALMQQTEVIFSLILGYFILKERIKHKQIFATILVLTGILLLVYRRTFLFNIGDVLLIMAPLGLQISYIAAMKSVKKVGVFPTVAARFLYGALMLFLLSTFFHLNQFTIFFDATIMAPLLLLSFFTILALVLWYEALHRINLSKATTILAPWPAVSLILAWLFLAEIPTAYQLFGLIAIVAGLELVSVGTYLMVSVKSEKRI